MRSAVVVPSNRPERLREFIAAWEPQFKNDSTRLIICEDALENTTGLPLWAEHFCWQDIDEQLGDKAGCIPRRSGGIRDFGFWLAGNDTSIDMIVSLDDDVLPIAGVDFLAEHWRALDTLVSLKWWPLFPGFQLRGEPYGNDAKAKTVLNLGLWHGFPDVDAYGQLCDPDCEETFGAYDAVHPPRPIPVGMYAPLCGMNVAFRREVAPFYYFPSLPSGYKRFDDIWCGLIFKRVADLHGWAVTYGLPALRHERASNPLSNLKQEMLGYGINERMWQVIDAVTCRHTPIATYRAIAGTIALAFPELTETVKAMHTWAGLWG